MARPGLFGATEALSTFVIAFLLFTPFAKAQTTLDDVHIIPRAEAAPDSAIGHEATIKVNSSLVLVPVTITDGMNRVVTGLEQANFEVFENKQHQQIKHFSNEDEPISLGIILDTSGSMEDKIDWAREAVKQLLDTANPQDEFFLMNFANQPQVLVDFTNDMDKIKSQLVYLAPKGRTALLDAVYLGINKMRNARYARRALMIISDGGDNRSRYTEKELKSLVKEADVLVYAAGIYDHSFATEEERLGPELLNEISTTTGAQCFVVDTPNQLPAIARTVGVQLRNQYVLGYRPDTNTTGKSIWRKIVVRLKLPKGAPHLGVFAKSGYYSSAR